MRILLALALLASPATAQPPREQSPPPSRESLQEGLGEGSSDVELERAAAAASAYPLGTRENPVRVGGPEGARAYIGRLRCADGKQPKTAVSAPAGVGAYGTIVESYWLECGAAGPARTALIVDMYHEEHREDRAPAGFTITP